MITEAKEDLSNPWLIRAGRPIFAIHAQPLTGGPGTLCEMWVSNNRRLLEKRVNEANSAEGVEFRWWVRKLDHVKTEPDTCDTCEAREVAVSEDRWGDPICQSCIDRMEAMGRRP